MGKFIKNWRGPKFSEIYPFQKVILQKKKGFQFQIELTLDLTRALKIFML